MVNKLSLKRPLFSFIAILIGFLLLADTLVIHNQRNTLVDFYNEHSSHELQLTGDFVSESLLRNDYASVENFVTKRGKDDPEIISLSILTDNDFILANYVNKANQSKYTLSLEKSFTYANNKYFTIKILKDSAAINNEISKLTEQLILTSIFFALMLGVLMWKTLQITAITPLQKEISERIKVESELVHARDEALQASQHKSEFLANMSHELRTPLNSIIGFTSIIKDEMAGPVTDEQKHQLDMVYSSANHLLGLINSVLDLAKVEAGKFQTVKTRFNLHKFLEDLFTVLKPLAEKKSLKFDVNVNCVSEEIYTDRSMLSQILMNLLSNAIKFTEQGSIALDCKHEKDKLIIKVTDTGIGISHEFIDQVFDAFKQQDASISRKYEGTGLGLSISQHFSLLLGGHLEVESEEGKGSIFTLVLPISEQ